MFEKQVLGLRESQAALNVILERAAKEHDRPIAVVVLDDLGNLICMARMDRASPFTYEMAFRKAYTAATRRRDSRAWGEYLQQTKRDNSEFGSNLTGTPGGVCVRKPGDDSGTIFGAIGVSGLASDQDEALAFAGLKALQAVAWK